MPKIWDLIITKLKNRQSSRRDSAPADHTLTPEERLARRRADHAITLADYNAELDELKSEAEYLASKATHLEAIKVAQNRINATTPPSKKWYDGVTKGKSTVILRDKNGKRVSNSLTARIWRMIPTKPMVIPLLLVIVPLLLLKACH